MDGYHGDQLEYLMSEWGFELETIERFKFGYCRACPTSPYSDSYSIPYYWQSDIVNLRHRLLRPNGQGKYRPEMTGLNNAIFNADLLRTDEPEIVLVEGEFKAAQLCQRGIPAVGIAGINSFKPRWAQLFKRAEVVFVALDPGADNNALDIANTLAPVVGVKVARFPVKPDDFFVKYGGNVDDFRSFLMVAKKIV